MHIHFFRNGAGRGRKNRTSGQFEGSFVVPGVIVLTAWMLLFLGGCATHSVGQIMDPPGFFHGLFHGFVMLFSFIGSFFTDYEVYAFPNAGTWYDLGFLLGASIFFGGSGAGSRGK